MTLNFRSCCYLIRCPLTLSGTGGFTKGCGQGICFASNPEENYANFGYTEYIELGFNTSVIVSQLINGENMGMGAVKNILAKVFLSLIYSQLTCHYLDHKIFYSTLHTTNLAPTHPYLIATLTCLCLDHNIFYPTLHTSNLASTHYYFIVTRILWGIG